MTFGLSCRCAVGGVRSEAVMGVPGGEQRPYQGAEQTLQAFRTHALRDGHLTEAVVHDARGWQSRDRLRGPIGPRLASRGRRAS
jgi:hypothetical protein